MRILVFSDLHRCIDMTELHHIIQSMPTEPDLAVSLGDISSSELADIRNIVGDIPMYGVPGNHDTEETLTAAKIPSLHSGLLIYDGGIRFAGFGGSIRYKKGVNFMFSQQESQDLIQKLPPANILLTHDMPLVDQSPPTPVNRSSGFLNKLLLRAKKEKKDEKICSQPHAGLQGITDYLDRISPSLLIHGHIHQNKVYRYKNTDIVSVYGAALVTFDDNKLIAVQALISPDS